MLSSEITAFASWYVAVVLAVCTVISIVRVLQAALNRHGLVYARSVRRTLLRAAGALMFAAASAAFILQLQGLDGELAARIGTILLALAFVTVALAFTMPYMELWTHWIFANREQYERNREWIFGGDRVRVATRRSNSVPPMRPRLRASRRLRERARARRSG